jgi:hypothetical protein
MSWVQSSVCGRSLFVAVFCPLQAPKRKVAPTPAGMKKVSSCYSYYNQCCLHAFQATVACLCMLTHAHTRHLLTRAPIHSILQPAAPAKQTNPLYEKRPKTFGELWRWLVCCVSGGGAAAAARASIAIHSMPTSMKRRGCWCAAA